MPKIHVTDAEWSALGNPDRMVFGDVDNPCVRAVAQRLGLTHEQVLSVLGQDLIVEVSLAPIVRLDPA